MCSLGWKRHSLVAFWSLQHMAPPLVPGAGSLADAMLTTVPVATMAVVLYTVVLRRRLLPLVAMHWLADVLAALSSCASWEP